MSVHRSVMAVSLLLGALFLVLNAVGVVTGADWPIHHHFN